MARPRVIESPELFDMLVDCYVADCTEEKKPMSVVGLSLFMGLNSKHGFYGYGEREEFADSVERAKSFVEQQHYDNTTVGRAVNGNTFLLKAVYGYQDKQVIQMDPMTVTINGKDADL